MNNEDAKALLTQFGFKPEEFQVGAWFNPSTVITGYPKPFRTHHFIINSYKPNIEENYYWLINHAKFDFGYVDMEKTLDLSAQAEQSALFGTVQQRLGIQQDRVTQYLATIGKFVKEMFQMVRELRIIDEKLEHYEKSYGTKKENPFEISLKGNWIDLVEGGAKNPASVYGMSRDLQFTTLPDLFFGAPPLDKDKVDAYVDGLDFNKAVKNVLKRKLGTFSIWKEKTRIELNNRRVFMIRYLRQHYEIIRMYMEWVKPYLRHIRRLQSRQEYLDHPELVSGFESAMMEVEVLQKKRVEGCKKVWGVILQSFIYTAMPSMAYQSEGYQRGPLHGGEVKVYMRSYAWTDEEVQAYKEMRAEEDLKMIGVIDQSLNAAMKALGDDLNRYLKEGEATIPGAETEKPGKPKEEKGESVIEPFVGIFKGFGELFGYKSKPKSDKNDKDERPLGEIIAVQNKDPEIISEKKKTQGHLGFTMYTVYKNFKKTHGMLAWR